MSKRVIVFGTATEQALVRTIEELKRENAALRERLDSVQKSHFTLSKDNAALRADKERLANAAKEVLASYILTVRVELGHPCPENLVICRELRAAIGAARKEAQP